MMRRAHHERSFTGEGEGGEGSAHHTHIKAKVVEAFDIALVILGQFDVFPTCASIQVPGAPGELDLKHQPVVAVGNNY